MTDLQVGGPGHTQAETTIRAESESIAKYC
jgi:hypothetical protein